MANKSSVRGMINFLTFAGSGMFVTPQTWGSSANWSGYLSPGQKRIGVTFCWASPAHSSGRVVLRPWVISHTPTSSPPTPSTPRAPSGTGPFIYPLPCSVHVAATQSQLLPCPDIPIPTSWLSISSRLPLWITESQGPLCSRRNNPFSGTLEFYICTRMQTPITENILSPVPEKDSQLCTATMPFIYYTGMCK